MHGELSIQNLLDDGFVKNAKTITKFSYKDGTYELLQFVVVLTETGKQFIADWESTEENRWMY